MLPPINKRQPIKKFVRQKKTRSVFWLFSTLELFFQVISRLAKDVKVLHILFYVFNKFSFL